MLIVDDLCKNASEAMNERVLEGHWDWYNNTMRSRLEARAKQINIQTRWSTKDLTGRLLDHEGEKWYVISMPAFNEAEEAMLCDDIFSRETYEELSQTLDPVIFQGNYQQRPFDSIDKLYSIKTYRPDELPNDGVVHGYIDTADKGEDYLAAIFYRTIGTKIYVVDVLYTQESMEVTEPKTADMAIKNGCTRLHIESNNGGGGFGRSVQRIMAEKGYTGCQFEMFHQTENKVARILSNATSVSNSMLMPDDWKYLWPAAHRDLVNASRSAKWLHDDIYDAVTGTVQYGLGAGMNPRCYPDYNRNLISKINVVPGETVYFAQSLNGAYPHGVCAVLRLLTAFYCCY